MTTPFFELTATHNPHRWYLPLSESLSVGRAGNSHMFGGVGLAAAIQAMERTCQRPVIWATAQYLSHARPPSVVDLDVWLPAQGHNTSQARVTGHVGDKEILTVNAALGRRYSEFSHQWVQAPDAPAPEDCPPGQHWRGEQDDLHNQIEFRVAKGHYGDEPNDKGVSEDGRLILWMRPKQGQTIDSGMLAIFADHIASGVGNALGRNAGGNSLDNTIRFRRIIPTDWVLCEIQMHSIDAGFGHGAMRMFARDGELMATASQSLIVRIHDDAERRAPRAPHSP
jgi:acyl-CoA thioesterase-2